VSTIGDIAAGLKANLDVLPVNVSKYPRSNPVGPLIHMWPVDPLVYHRAMQIGFSEVNFTVELWWPYTDDSGTASQVYAFLDPVGDRSVRQAIEADKTLGGVCDRVQVMSCSGLAVGVTQDNQPRLTSAWAVRIILDGSS
jgi:hypothetical protein